MRFIRITMIELEICFIINRTKLIQSLKLNHHKSPRLSYGWIFEIVYKLLMSIYNSNHDIRGSHVPLITYHMFLTPNCRQNFILMVKFEFHKGSWIKDFGTQNSFKCWIKHTYVRFGAKTVFFTWINTHILLEQIQCKLSNINSKF